MPYLAMRLKERIESTTEESLSDAEIRRHYRDLRRDALALCDEVVFLRHRMPYLQEQLIEAKGRSRDDD